MLNKIALQLFSDFSFFIRLCSTDPKKSRMNLVFIYHICTVYINPKCRELVTDKSISIISDSTTGSGSHTVTKIYNHRLMVAHCYKIQTSLEHCVSPWEHYVSLLNHYVSHLKDCWMYRNWKTAECISIGRLLNL